MATFLQLCQDVARESGVVPTIGDPQSVVGQEGRLYRVVEWTQGAWADIQLQRTDWQWMQGDFEANTVAATRFYDGAAMGITRFSSWQWSGTGENEIFTIFDPVLGQATEGYLNVLDYDTFRRRAMIGAAVSETGMPAYVTVMPDGRLGFYPTPDRGYTIRGRYRKSNQIMTANADVPEMPVDFHAVIKWRALIFLGQFDEAVNQQPMFGMEFTRIMNLLRGHQLPRPSLGGPLA